MKHPAPPYLRPDESPEDFAELAEDCRNYLKPASDPESEALVATIIYLQWRLKRYELDEALIKSEGVPALSQEGAKTIRTLIESLEQMLSWACASFRFMERVHNLDVSEAIDIEGTYESLGVSVKNPPTAPFPRGTKPN